MESTNPSPPSEMGSFMTERSGKDSSAALSMISHASLEEMVPLYESGAIIILFISYSSSYIFLCSYSCVYYIVQQYKCVYYIGTQRTTLAYLVIRRIVTLIYME